MCKVRYCSCKSDYQDEQYGKNKRVWNKGGDGRIVKWRCTVCGTQVQE